MIDLFEYNHWANSRLISSLKKESAVCYKALSISFGSIYSLMLHMYYYDLKTYKFVTENIHNVKLNKKISLTDLFSAIHCLSEQWILWIKKEDSLTANENIKALLRLNNHNIYHRGQLVNTLSMLELKPESLDVYLYQEIKGEKNAY